MSRTPPARSSKSLSSAPPKTSCHRSPSMVTRTTLWSYPRACASATRVSKADPATRIPISTRTQVMRLLLPLLLLPYRLAEITPRHFRPPHHGGALARRSEWSVGLVKAAFAGVLRHDRQCH